MKVIVAGDHYTVELLTKIEKYLKSKGIDYTNVGTMDKDKPVKLQDIIPAMVNPLRDAQYESGILACGTGVGVEIGANKFRGIRASLCTSAKQAEYARVYDNANVICFSSWLTDRPEQILDAWFAHEFDGDKDRAKMIQDFDSWS